MILESVALCYKNRRIFSDLQILDRKILFKELFFQYLSR